LRFIVEWNKQTKMRVRYGTPTNVDVAVKRVAMQMGIVLRSPDERKAFRRLLIGSVEADDMEDREKRRAESLTQSRAERKIQMRRPIDESVLDETARLKAEDMMRNANRIIARFENKRLGVIECIKVNQRTPRKFRIQVSVIKDFCNGFSKPIEETDKE